MKIGTITQVSGPVVDVEFEAGHLPKITMEGSAICSICLSLGLIVTFI